MQYVRPAEAQRPSRNRDDAIRRVNEIWEQTRNSPTSTGQYNSVNGLEEYLAQIWKNSHR
jgi:hypothetical protein